MFRKLGAGVAAVLTVATIAGPSAGAAATLRISPKSIDFGTRRVGATYYDKVRITNTSGVPLTVLVEAGLPDDFGFGLLPGSTCPALSPGAVMAPRQSCDAVVRFTPSEGFVGWHATGSLVVRTTDPATGATTATEVPVTGTAKL